MVLHSGAWPRTTKKCHVKYRGRENIGRNEDQQPSFAYGLIVHLREDVTLSCVVHNVQSDHLLLARHNWSDLVQQVVLVYENAASCWLDFNIVSRWLPVLQETWLSTFVVIIEKEIYGKEALFFSLYWLISCIHSRFKAISLALLLESASIINKSRKLRMMLIQLCRIKQSSWFFCET